MFALKAYYYYCCYWIEMFLLGACLYIARKEEAWCVYGHFQQHLLHSFSKSVYDAITFFFSSTYSGYVVMLEWVCSTLF
jgi:hypothetical protein